MRVSNIFLIISILFLMVSEIACTKKTLNEPPKKLAVNQVRLPSEVGMKGIVIKAVEKKDFPLTLDLPGRVAIPDKDFFVLSARVSGRIDSLTASIGDRVHAGSVVGMLWSPDLATAAEEYVIALSQKNTELIELSVNKLKSLGLTPKDAVSGKISFPLRSGIEGVVLDKKLTVGNAVNPGDAILSIGKTGSFQFQADIPPSDAQQIKPGMKITFDDSPSLKAKIDSISAIADPISRLVRVRGKFEVVGNMSLAQETFLKAKVVIKETSSLVTSTHALIVDESSQYIFIQDEQDPSRVLRVKVKVLSSFAGEMAFEAVDSKTDLSHAKVVNEGALLLNGVLEDSE